MTVGGPDAPLDPVDPFDARRSVAGTGLLRPFTDATVLDAADVHVARTLSRLAGGSSDEVQLAVALAVRAVRLGHVYIDLETVATTTTIEDEELGVDLARLPWPAGPDWTRGLAASALTSVGLAGPDARPLRLIGSRLYLDRYWRHERAIVDDLSSRSTGPPPPIDEPTLAAGLAQVFGPRNDADGADDDLQRIAAATAVLRRFTVVAGGPGTGKTTTVARILALLHQQADALGLPPPHIGLAAPTGKAAARLEEAVHVEAATMTVGPAIRDALLGVSASTLHRLLGWQPGNRSRFRHDATNHLPHSVVVVDESSMVSLSMMAKLLAAVGPSARLVLVGDPRQLASIEAGAVLGDIVGRASSGLLLGGPARVAVESALGRPVAAGDPGAHPIADGTVVLRRIHRFGGAIAELAAKIEQGDTDGVVAALRAGSGSGSDAVRWIEPDGHLDPTAAPELAGVRASVLGAARAVVAAARDGRAEEALAALRSVQILCSHRRGPFGANLWRGDIERWLRSTIDGYGAGPWYAGRPLLVTENDYGLGVFNGDTGVVVDDGDGRLRAVFERRGEILRVRPTRLSSVDSLYAMTIHKSQGSQFDEVVVVLPESSPVLTRELLYTGVTRASHRVTVVATEAAVRAAVDRPIARASGLADALWGG